MPETNSEQQRFTELLPFYVNQTLATSERDWIETYLRSHPDAQHQLKFERLLHETTQRTVSSVPEAERIAMLRDALNQSRPKPAWYTRWLGIDLAKPGSAKGYRVSLGAPAFAAMLLVIFGQTLWMGITSTDSGSERAVYRSAGAPCPPVAQLRVTFKPDAKSADIMMLMRSVMANISAGPSESGELWLMLPQGTSAENVLTELRSSALIEEALLATPSTPTSDCK